MFLQMALFHAFSCLSNIPLYVPYLLYPFICRWILDCFHVLAAVNRAVVNVEMHVSFCIRVFSGYMPGSGIAGSYNNDIFSFWENLHTFSVVAAQIYIPTNSVGGFPFLHRDQTRSYFFVFLFHL